MKMFPLREHRAHNVIMVKVKNGKSRREEKAWNGGKRRFDRTGKYRQKTRDSLKERSET
jgi:hypothetical protein